MRPLSPTFAGITAKPSTKPSMPNTFPHIPSIERIKKTSLLHRLIYGGMYPRVSSLLLID